MQAQCGENMAAAKVYIDFNFKLFELYAELRSSRFTTFKNSIIVATTGDERIYKKQLGDRSVS